MTSIYLAFFILISTGILLNCKVRISQEQNPDDQNPTSPVYMTLVEGTKDIYEICKLICKLNQRKTMYSETTELPNYGKIFRCQCDDDFTVWYNLESLSQLSNEIIRGDSLFNAYLNMPANCEDDCRCDGMKEMLMKLVATTRPTLI